MFPLHIQALYLLEAARVAQERGNRGSELSQSLTQYKDPLGSLVLYGLQLAA